MMSTLHNFNATAFTRSAKLWLGAVALTLSNSPTLAMQWQDWQVNGFASQAFLKSSGNNFFGDSLDGSWDFMEAGISAKWRANPRLIFSGQLFSRDAGSTDNGDVNLDYLFADYKIIDKVDSGLGVRLGRVKNRYGFYNDSRDVLFTRPSILMPQAIYFEGNGLRELFFSSDGFEFFGHWDSETSFTEFSISHGIDRDISDETLKNLIGPTASLYDDVQTERPIFSRLSHSFNGGNSRLALSSINSRYRIRDPGIDTSLDIEGYVLSGQQHYLNWSFTAEYSQLDVLIRTPLGSDDTLYNAFYLQTQYRFTPQLNISARYEQTDTDTADADPSDHYVLSLQWQPSQNWLVSADIYRMEGAFGIPVLDNPQGQEDQTELFALMLAWRF